MGAQELEVVDLDGMLAADRAYDAGNRIGMARPVKGDAWLVDVDTLQRGREPVRIAFAPNFAVGDDVEPGLLLRLDREHGRIVLRFGEIGLGDAPKLPRPHTRGKPARELRSIDEPFGLRVRSDQHRRQKHEFLPSGIGQGGQSTPILRRLTPARQGEPA